MLDIQFIRDNPDRVSQNARDKGYDVDVDGLLAKDRARRDLLAQIEALRGERNRLAEAGKGQRPTAEQIARGKELKDQLSELGTELEKVQAELNKLVAAIPNMATDDVPVGGSEADNVVVKTWGEPPRFDFQPRNDGELGLALDLIDKERAAKIAGARFAYLKGDLVRLQFALIQFTLDELADVGLIERLINENGLNLTPTAFTPVLPPAVASTAVYEATGRLNSEEQTYKLADDDLWLNASAEHTLAPMYMDEILSEAQLPIRYIGYSTAFRREAGTYGKDTEGIFRMHQFDKLEMETFSTPETGPDEHRLMIAIQEHLLQQLEISYQVILKCTADIGKPNARGVDINAWMPGQGAYRETHTADFIGDYQTRRMKSRFKRQNGEMALMHTNDATAFAMGRTLKAIVENYQTADGHVRVPAVLKPYLGGKEQI